MTVPPYTEDPEAARPYFRKLRELRDQLAARNFPGVSLDELSMGMSHDFEVAIEEGSTCVRIGTAIFGSRSRGERPRAMIPVRDTPSGATFQVKVHPRAKKNAITGEIGEALKLALTAPPVDGRANDACIAFFAEFLNVPRSSVTIAAGETSRNKLIRVRGMSAGEVEGKLRSAFG